MLLVLFVASLVGARSVVARASKRRARAELDPAGLRGLAKFSN